MPELKGGFNLPSPKKRVPRNAPYPLYNHKSFQNITREQQNQHSTIIEDTIVEEQSDDISRSSSLSSCYVLPENGDKR